MNMSTFLRGLTEETKSKRNASCERNRFRGVSQTLFEQSDRLRGALNGRVHQRYKVVVVLTGAMEVGFLRHRHLIVPKVFGEL